MNSDKPRSPAGTDVRQRSVVLQTLKIVLLPAGVALVLTSGEQAADAATSFQVTAAVYKACTVSTPATLGFGTYDPNASTDLTGTTNFTVTCSSGTPYSVGLNAGIGTGATLANRVLTSTSAAAGANTLTYGLYKDPAHTVAWDNSVAAAGYSGSGAAQSLTVYGKIPANQYRAAPASDYADAVTMTLTY